MEKFSIAFGDLVLAGDVIKNKSNEVPNLLFLHGAGFSDRTRWEPLRNALFESGIGSYAFDFVGHGLTGGDLASSSLKGRTEQALRVIAGLKISTPLVIAGSSMGAYTALKVSERISVKTLIFLVPAIYDEDAYTIPFGPQFTETIRKPRSWTHSDAWDILARFTGKLLIVAGENDDVVSHELTQKIYDSAIQTKKKELYWADSSHALGDFIRDHSSARERIVTLIAGYSS